MASVQDAEILVGPLGGMTAADVEVAGPPGRQALRMFLRNRAAVFGVILFVAVLLMTLFGPMLYENDANDIVARPFLAPGADNAPPLGTDY
ncbi:MAG: hypothetical protein OEW83_17085, partial [Acidimicrobiia bacterium]|nr:hypothetical protein [Acidimicrobiia bacterium]